MRVVQVLDSRTEPYAYAEFNCASNVQICIVCRDHPSFKRPSFEVESRWLWAQGQRHYDCMEQINPGVGPRYSYVVHALAFSIISESKSCPPRFLIPKIASMSSAPDRNLKGRWHGVWRVRTNDLGINSPSLWPTEPRLHVKFSCSWIWSFYFLIKPFLKKSLRLEACATGSHCLASSFSFTTWRGSRYGCMRMCLVFVECSVCRHVIDYHTRARTGARRPPRVNFFRM